MQKISGKIKTGLIGYGFAGATFHAPIIGAVDALDLCAVASSRPATVHAALPGVRVVADATQLLADPALELIVIAAPNQAHFALAHAALMAGKHVVVDKPFTLRSAEAQTLIDCAARQQRMLSVYHNRRWDADFLTLRQLLAQGTLGRIATVESRFDRFRPEIRQRWREQAAPGGGLLYDLGPHLIDQALQLFGPPERLYADLALQRDGAAAVDYFHLVLYYERMRVLLRAGSLVQEPTPRFTVHGERGSFIKFGLDRQEDGLRAGGNPGLAGWGEDAEPGWLNLAAGGNGQPERLPIKMLAGCYQAYYEGVAHAIRHATAPPVSAADGLHTIALIEAATASAAEGKVIRL
jgi:predicted dehydrogenase